MLSECGNCNCPINKSKRGPQCMASWLPNHNKAPRIRVGEAFEKWYSENFYSGLRTFPVWNAQKNTYEDFSEHLAWNAFQQGMRYRDELEKGHD